MIENNENENVSLDDLENDELDNKSNETEEKQSSEENKKWADLRRKWKEERNLKDARIKELEKEKDEIAFKIKAENIDNEILLDLGIEKIESDEDLALVEAYKTAYKEGKSNPVAYAYKNAYKAKKEAKIVQNKREEAIKADLKKLIDKYGSAPNINDLMNDELFKNKYAPLLNNDKPNLSDVYSLYKDEVDRNKILLNKEKAKKDSSLYGNVKSNVEAKNVEKSYLNMSKEEKIKYLKSKNFI